ncbi:TetR/AcrR family transcriptional regulator [Nocardioides sp. GY 10113]|uniref:TetR/AcrR family transcriptional regulator n=1 Tax=Nocardioides sp. GY 10113 TaxID=2569761 RepID=UPI0010A8A0A1|nr:TetR/AcrR family transcriptional regulator [Nocardioides sp. GY 10113]TIC85894.1 TetR/AcrR family transcriptional regulator [Nocardioides sp. GY 10113]
MPPTASSPHTSGTARVRLSPERRREQLLALGVQLFSQGSIEEISIDRLAEVAGVSRGLLYHYFGSKQGFYEAVVQCAADDLVAQTAPSEDPDPMVRLRHSMAAYVDYVVDNLAGYRSLVRAAAGGNETLRRIYDEARAALTDRIFRPEGAGELIPDTPATRLLVRGWAAFAEETVLAWCAEPDGLTRDDVVRILSDALPALVAALG